MTQFTQARFTVPPPQVTQEEWNRVFKPKPKATKRKPKGKARG